MIARHVVRAAAVLAAGALVASGCASDDSDDSGNTGGGGTVGGTVVVARTGDITGLDPHTATAFQTIQALELVHGTLVRLDKDLNVVPGLAESWEFSADGSALTLTLRDGVTYHDGDPFTSADVAASLNRIMAEETGAVAASNFAEITSIDTPDDSTVVLNLSGPGGPVLAALADTNAAILSDEDIAAGTAATKPNGTGPFTFVAWSQGRSVELERNPDFWDGAPKLDKVVVRVIPDEASVLNALRAGEAQLGVLTDPTIVQQVSGGDLEVLRAPAISYHVLMLNVGRGPLGDERVRQAIACAVDRQGVIDAAALGEGEDVGPLTVPVYQSDPVAGRPCAQRDVNRARSLLAEAGYADGFSLNTIVMTGGYSTAVAEGQTLQAQLAEVGVDLELETLESSVYVDRWLAADFDAAVALNGGRVDPHTMYARYFVSGGALNNVGFTSPELDDILARGAAETDPAARVPIYHEFAAAVQEAAPWIWLFRGYEYRVISAGVSGFTAMPNGSLQYLATTSLG